MKEKSTRRFKKKSIVHIILSIIVIFIMVARFLRADYFAVFLCLMTLLLFDIPVIANKLFKVTMSKELEVIIMLFVFAAEILGELGSFYTHISWWDTMLHTVNGFLMAAIGFALIDILNNSPKFHVNLSPLFVAVVAFCISMTIGVLWEFFEFGMDTMIGTDMQKDRIITKISSVALNPNGLNEAVNIPNITSTALMKNGDVIYTINNGYLDVGLIDTMKDLIVNCIGALVFSTIGYFYVIGRNKGIFASKFIPQYTPQNPNEDCTDEKK